MALTPICCIRKSHEFPEHSEYLVVFPDTLRIVCSVVMATNPLRQAPMSMFYVNVGPGHIRTRLRPEYEWQDDFYRIEQDKAFWSHRIPNTEQHPWTLILPVDLPDWFEAFQFKAQKRMNESWAVVASKEIDADRRQ
jgi:hypothetical protein